MKMKKKPSRLIRAFLHFGIEPTRPFQVCTLCVDFFYIQTDGLM